MFAENLVESGPHAYASRAKTTFYSFGLQIGLVAFLILLPVIFPMALPLLMPPSVKSVSLVRDTQLTPSKPNQRPSAGGAVNVSAWEVPRTVPKGLPKPGDPGPAPETIFTGIPSTGPIGVGSPVDLMGSVKPPEVRQPEPPKIVRRSEMELGALLSKVQPTYPLIARNIRLQGEVVLRAIIARDGSVKNLTVASGHELLSRAAEDAVRQWRYRPYILNGQPVEVETQITVRFIMGQ